MGELDRRTPLVGSSVPAIARAIPGAGSGPIRRRWIPRLPAAHRIGLAGRRVLLKGCGGAGRAIAARIADEGAAALVIDDPEAAKTTAFVARLRARAPACDISLGSDSRGRFDLVVNASPLGMAADDPSPVPDEVVAQCAAVVDIVIAAQESRLAALARAHGKPLVAGSAMVEGQADLFLGFLLGPATTEEAVLPADAPVKSPA